MNESVYRNKLWDKVTKEFDNFRKEILKTSKEEIIESSFKISSFYNLLDMCHPVNSLLTIKEVKALLKEKNPIQTLYSYYLKTDTYDIQNLYDSIHVKIKENLER